MSKPFFCSLCIYEDVIPLWSVWGMKKMVISHIFRTSNIFFFQVQACTAYSLFSKINLMSAEFKRCLNLCSHWHLHVCKNTEATGVALSVITFCLFVGFFVAPFSIFVSLCGHIASLWGRFLFCLCCYFNFMFFTCLFASYCISIGWCFLFKFHLFVFLNAETEFCHCPVTNA